MFFSMPKWTMTALSFVAVLATATVILHHPKPVRAQSGHLQIASISLGPVQPLTVPNAASQSQSSYLAGFPDEHVTFFPPASGSGPYLVFGAGLLDPANLYGASVLQSADLLNFTFATGLGYQPQVMVPPVQISKCNPAYDSTTFDENYAAPGFVAQDPTLPAGNLVMLYEAENWCPGGVYTSVANLAAQFHAVGFARSSDNGKTWPAPAASLSGGPNRYPAIQDSLPNSTTATQKSDYSEAGFVDKSLDGNYYLYATYLGPHGSNFARAQLGQNPVTFQRWYNGSFSSPGIGGTDSPQPWTGACPSLTFAVQHTISYVDNLGLYLLTFVCQSNASATPSAWYYTTATSLDLQDWSPPQMMQNGQFPENGACAQNGWYSSFMSPGAAPSHVGLTGTAFYKGCVPSQFSSRTFTITTQPQPAPVLTSGSLANGATYLSGGLVPGSWAQVKGTGLANVTRIWTGYDFLNLGSNLPTSLSGVQVMVNNTPAAVYYVSPTQIDFQVPTGVTGTASMQVINNGTASNTLTAASAASAPGLFPNTVNGVNYPAAVYASGAFVGPGNVAGYVSASVGYHISLYATGLVSAPGGVLPTAQSISGVTVTVGTVTIPADFAGQTPYVGEFQINFTMPQQFASMPAGNYPISISLNGVSSPTMIGNPPGPIVLPVTP